ncbi:hypothetical protein Tco_1347315, partial [Tanacetum coccineum]
EEIDKLCSLSEECETLQQKCRSYEDNEAKFKATESSLNIQVETQNSKLTSLSHKRIDLAKDFLPHVVDQFINCSSWKLEDIEEYHPEAKSLFLRKPTMTDVEKLYAFHEEKHVFL